MTQASQGRSRAGSWGVGMAALHVASVDVNGGDRGRPGDGFVSTIRSANVPHTDAKTAQTLVTNGKSVIP